jgi:hypothetical protein
LEPWILDILAAGIMLVLVRLVFGKAALLAVTIIWRGVTLREGTGGIFLAVFMFFFAAIFYVVFPYYLFIFHLQLAGGVYVLTQVYYLVTACKTPPI